MARESTGANTLATSHPLAAAAGQRMFVQGGNAVDAALAAAIALVVVEPVSTGLGGDGFALLWDGCTVSSVNGSGAAPHAWTKARLDAVGGIALRGWNSVTVPGIVEMWNDLSRRNGRLPFECLFDPAIELARSGFLISEKLAERWTIQVDELSGQPGFAAAFMPHGRGPIAGEVFRNPSLADSLEEVAITGGRSFYEGPLARKIIDHSAQWGGAMTLDDLARHKTKRAGTVSYSFAGRQIHEAPLNSQGLVVPLTLGIFRHLEWGSHAVDTLHSIHLQIEAFKLAVADIGRYAAMPQAMSVSPDVFLEQSYLKSRASLIGPTAQTFGPGVLMGRGTVVVLAADADGNAITLLQSNYAGFGSGVVVPGTGISMHNRGACFTELHHHPNAPAPDKQPLHTLLPAMVIKDGALEYCLGVTGGNMQPQGQVQLLLRMLLDDASPLSAIDAPRYRFVSDLAVNLEPQCRAEVRAGLIERGHHITPIQPGYMDFGSAQVIRREGEYWKAASDERKDGTAVAA